MAHQPTTFGICEMPSSRCQPLSSLTSLTLPLCQKVARAFLRLNYLLPLLVPSS